MKSLRSKFNCWTLFIALIKLNMQQNFNLKAGSHCMTLNYMFSSLIFHLQIIIANKTLSLGLDWVCSECMCATATCVICIMQISRSSCDVDCKAERASLKLRNVDSVMKSTLQLRVCILFCLFYGQQNLHFFENVCVLCFVGVVIEKLLICMHSPTNVQERDGRRQ